MGWHTTLYSRTRQNGAETVEQYQALCQNAASGCTSFIIVPPIRSLHRSGFFFLSVLILLVISIMCCCGTPIQQSENVWQVDFYPRGRRFHFEQVMQYTIERLPLGFILKLDKSHILAWRNWISPWGGFWAQAMMLLARIGCYVSSILSEACTLQQSLLDCI